MPPTKISTLATMLRKYPGPLSTTLPRSRSLMDISFTRITRPQAQVLIIDMTNTPTFNPTKRKIRISTTLIIYSQPTGTFRSVLATSTKRTFFLSPKSFRNSETNSSAQDASRMIVSTFLMSKLRCRLLVLRLLVLLRCLLDRLLILLRCELLCRLRSALLILNRLRHRSRCRSWSCRCYRGRRSDRCCRRGRSRRCYRSATEQTKLGIICEFFATSSTKHK